MEAHAAHMEHDGGHASPAFYWTIGVILTVITAAEVAIFYVEALSAILVPALLIMSLGKFALVVMYYMHLKFDHGIFSAMFLAGFVLAIFMVVALMALAHWVPRMGAWGPS